MDNRKPDLTPVDLTALDGIHAYLERQIIPALKVQYDRMGSVMPFGVVLAGKLKGHILAEPMAVGIFNQAMQQETEKGMRTRVRKSVTATHALGALFIHQVNRKVVIQLESPTLGEHVWDITLQDMRTGELRPARPWDEACGVTRTRFMPQKWMN
jgi:hypothetical protein